MKWIYTALMAILCSFSSVSYVAESEPNNTAAEADSIAVNGSHTGAINVAGDADWYVLKTNADGRITLNLTTASGKYINVFIYDANGTSLLKSGTASSNFSVIYDGAAAGIYFIKVFAYNAADIASYTIANTLTALTQPNDAEPDNTKATAAVIAVNGTASGHIGYANNQVRDSIDWFKVTTASDGMIKLSVTPGNGQQLYAYLYDNNGSTQLGSSYGSSSFSFSSDGLAAGTYYVAIRPYGNAVFAPYTLTDSLFTPANTNDAETNNTWDKAVAISANNNKKGHIGYYYNLKRDTTDWYKITTINNGQLRLKIAPSNNQYIVVSIYDTNATTLLKTANSNLPFDVTRDGLAPGTYFIKVNAYYASGFNTYALTDSFYNAAVAGDTEPNGSPATAGTIGVNSSKTGQVGYYYNNTRDTSDWYKIVTNADGLLKLKIKPGIAQSLYAYLYDANGSTQLAYNSGYDSFYVNMDGLAAGTYYVKITPVSSTGFAPYTFTDSLLLPGIANDAEPNNSFDKALPLAVNTTVNGHAGYYNNLKRDSADWYKVVLPADGLLKLSLKPYNGQYLYAYLYDADGKTLLKSQNGNSLFSFNMDGLAAGVFYVKVAAYYTYGFSSYSLSDSLFAVPVANDVEKNNTPAQAVVLNINAKYSGHVGYYNNLARDTTDWFKLTTNADGMLLVKLELTNTQNIKAELFDADAVKSLKAVWGTGTVTVNGDGLAPGTYYLKITSYYNTGFEGYTLTDSLITCNYAADAEPNNKAYLAKTIPSRSTVTGHVGFYANAVRDSSDWWKIDYSGTNNTLKFGLNIEARKSDNTRSYLWCYVFRDTTQPAIFSKYYNAASSAVSVTVPYSGTYYVKIIPYYSTDFAAYAILDSNDAINNVKVSLVNAVPAKDCSSSNSLQYAASGGVSPYTLQLYRNNLAYGSPVSFSSGFTFNNLPAGSYYARVWAFGGSGNVYTQSVTTSLVPVPANLSARIITTTSVMLKWTGYACAKYYQVQYKDKIAGSWATLKTTGNKDSVGVSNLIANNTYQFKVAAVDSGNNVIAVGTYSVVAEFTTTMPTQSSFANGISNSAGKWPGLYGDIAVYPNPAANVLHVFVSDAGAAVTLADISGKTVWSGRGDAVTSNGINVSGFAPGVYILKVSGANGKAQTRKVIVGK